MILGIDPSLTSTGCVVLDASGQPKLLKAIVTKPGQFENDLDRLLYIKNAVVKICKTFNVMTACMEGLSYGSTGSSLFQLGGLNYLLREAFHDMGIPYTIIQPKQLKKFAAGNGNANKLKMVDAVNTRWGQSLQLKHHDIADAFALAMNALEGAKNDI